MPPTEDPIRPDGLTHVDAAVVEDEFRPPAAGRGRRAAVIAVAAVVGLAGVGAAASFLALRGSGEALTTKVPADTDVVVTAYLDPAASQKVNLFRLTSSVPSLGGEQEVAGRAGEWIDSLLSETGLTHADLDWVGSQVGVAVDLRADADPAVALLIDADDETAAAESLRALRDSEAFRGTVWNGEDHGGVQVWAGAGDDPGFMGIVDGTVVIANDASAIDGVIAASHGETPVLADDPDYVDTMAALPEARLGMAYVAPDDLVRLLDRMGGVSLTDASTTAGVELDAVRGIGIAVSAEPDAIAVDAEMTLDPSKLAPAQLAAFGAEDHDNALLSMVPADALAFLGLQHLDAGLETALADLPPAQRDALEGSGLEPAISSLTGDLAVEVSMPAGASTPAGAVILGTDDEAAMRAAMKVIGVATGLARASTSAQASSSGAVLTGSGSLWRTIDHDGVTVTYVAGDGGGSGIAPAYAVFDGTGLIASSKEEAFRVIDAAQGAPDVTADDPVTAALGAVPGEDVVYVDLAGVIDAIADTGAMDPEIGDDLEALRTLVIGSDSDVEHQHARIVITVG
jgi:uncharacterized protein DUF3352